MVKCYLWYPTRDHSRPTVIFYLYQRYNQLCFVNRETYADDAKIYRQIVDPINDPHLLQMDLSNLMEWARKWQLWFNADKCESMCITHARDKSITQYMLDKPLKDVKSFKDLGVTISKDLSCSLLRGHIRKLHLDQFIFV